MSFPQQVRSVISDFAILISIMVMVGVDLAFGVNTPKLDIPLKFEPTNSKARGWIIPPLGKNPVWTIPAAAIPALLATILVFMDQQITALIVNRREHKLKVWRSVFCVRHNVQISFLVPAWKTILNNLKVSGKILMTQINMKLQHLPPRSWIQWSIFFIKGKISNCDFLHIDQPLITRPWRPLLLSHSLTKINSLPMDTFMFKVKHLYSAGKIWYFWFNFPTPAGQGSNTHPLCFSLRPMLPYRNPSPRPK